MLGVWLTKQASPRSKSREVYGESNDGAEGIFACFGSPVCGLRVARLEEGACGDDFGNGRGCVAPPTAGSSHRRT